MVSRACRKVLDVGGEEHAGDVLVVGLEMGYWNELRLLSVLDKAPDEDFALRSVSLCLQYEKETKHTELVPATSVDPSVATVTLATATPSSGTS